jgi:hypothetical protein
MRPVLALAVIGGLLVPSPAHAAVKFDPETNTGTVGASDVRKAFGWDSKTLRSRAESVTFRLNSTTSDNYRIVCRRGTDAKRTFTASYGRIGAFFELKSAVRSETKGYARVITGFRIDGAFAGASSMAILPPVGGPCPSPSSGSSFPADSADDNDVLVSAKVLSSTERQALTVYHGDKSHDLTVTVRPADPPSRA